MQKKEAGTLVARGSCDKCEPVWPSGKALIRLVSRGTSVRISFGSPSSSKVLVYGHCLVTVPHNY